MPAELGICQWFRHRDRVGLDRAVALMHELGLRRLRTVALPDALAARPFPGEPQPEGFMKGLIRFN